MPGTTTAVATAKGFRGVAQDFLAPELRALAERIHGFENLNRARFEDVDRQFVDTNRRIDELKADMNRQFADVNRRVDELKEDMNRQFADVNRQFADVNRRFDELKQDTDRRFEEYKQDMDRRYKEYKQDTDQRFEELKQHTDRQHEELKQYTDRRFDAITKDIAAIPFHIDRLIHEMNISNRLAVIERQSVGSAALLEK